MADGSVVRITVIDASGAPVEGAYVSVLRSTVAFPEIALVTDASGEVRLTLQEGAYAFGAHTGDGRSGEAVTEIKGENAEIGVTLTVTAAE